MKLGKKKRTIELGIGLSVDLYSAYVPNLTDDEPFITIKFINEALRLSEESRLHIAAVVRSEAARLLTLEAERTK